MADSPETNDFAKLTGDCVLVSYNRAAGSGDKSQRVAELITEIRKVGFEAVEASDLESLKEVASERAATGRLRAIVAAGGDGTLGLLMNHLAENAVFLPFPLGTENLAARYLGLSSDPCRAAEILQNGVILPHDAGSANGRLFSLMAGIGFDAEVVHRVHVERRGPIHRSTYYKPMFDLVRTYSYPEFRLELHEGNEVFETTARWAFISNIPRYAGGLQFSPAAAPCDGRLDLCSFARGGTLHGLRYLASVWMGRHARLADCTSRPFTKLIVRSEKTVRFQLDGDPGGELPLEIVCLPRRLKLVVAERKKPATF